MSELDPSTLGWFREAMGHAVRGLDRDRLLRPDQIDRLCSLPRRLERYPAGSHVRASAPLNRLKWIVAGWAGEMQVLPDTRRQICSVLLPGDVFAAPAPGAEAPCAVVAMTRLDCLDVHSLRPALAEPDLFDQLVDARLTDGRERRYDHLLRLGQLTAPQRLVHLLLELHERLRAVGLAGAAEFRLPMTQEHLADALGLSVVHVNRSLRMLRTSGLLRVRFGGVTFLDPHQLAALAGREALPI